jgi:FeS assembly protein IscX
MGLKWTDTREIAIELSEKYPDVNPISLRFTDLHQWVLALPNFDDAAERSGEKILEAIQMAWMEEYGG